MKQDVRKLLNKFKRAKNIKNGDLVIEVQIYRVLDADYAKRHCDKGCVEVSLDLKEKCKVHAPEECCAPHIMERKELYVFRR